MIKVRDADIVVRAFVRSIVERREAPAGVGFNQMLNTAMYDESTSTVSIVVDGRKYKYRMYN